MAAQRKFKTIAALTNAAANILNGAITSLAGPVGWTPIQPRLIVKHIRIVNKTAANHTVTLYIGATGASAAGTEFAFNGESIGANNHSDWYGEMTLESTDFLTGLADANTALTINIEYEAGFA